jgi:hypothetical protein
MYRLKLILCNFFILLSSGLASAQPEVLVTGESRPASLSNWQVPIPLASDTTGIETPEPLLEMPPSKPSRSEYSLHREELLKREPIRTQRAWLYSAVLPGLGQAYNRKYWKIYMLYGGFTLLGALSIYHHQEYQTSKRELIELTESNKKSTSLSNYVESHKRERNLYVIIAALWYVINIFDAYVDGTLKTFDISDNLEVIIQPTTSPTASGEPGIEVGVKLSLKP